MGAPEDEEDEPTTELVVCEVWEVEATELPPVVDVVDWLPEFEDEV